MLHFDKIVKLMRKIPVFHWNLLRISRQEQKELDYLAEEIFSCQDKHFLRIYLDYFKKYQVV